MNDTYLATARLLTEIAPTVFESGIFALKGGTAINLFLRDMPRLSVDLDLAFTDHRVPRADALAAINGALRAARDRLARRDFHVQTPTAAETGETKLLIRRGDLVVKVEVNTVIRGTVNPTWTAALTAAASEALQESFVGMTTEPVPLDALLATRERMFQELPSALDASEREFLRTLVRAQPDWSLLGIPHLEELPAIRWRLQNLEQLSRNQPERFRALADALDERLAR